MVAMSMLNWVYFQASTFSFPPFTTVKELADGTKKYGGIEYKIFAAIADKLNFDFTISGPTFCCLWGGNRVEGSEGNLTGIVGDLYGGFSDVAWNQLYYKFDRLALMDFTAANNFAESGFMVR